MSRSEVARAAVMYWLAPCCTLCPLCTVLSQPVQVRVRARDPRMTVFSLASGGKETVQTVQTVQIHGFTHPGGGQTT